MLNNLKVLNWNVLKTLFWEAEDFALCERVTASGQVLVTNDKGFELPALRGPFDVGFIDLEWNLEDSDKILSERAVMSRWYYPSTKNDNCKKSASSAPWLPSKAYYGAYGGIFQLHRGMAWLMGKMLFGKAKMSCSHGAQPISELAGIVVFSHGMGAMQTTNSSLCAQLASFGFLVVAAEHRDGSACLTFTDHYTTPMPFVHTSAEECEDDEAVAGDRWRRKAQNPFVARFVGHHSWRYHQLRVRAAELVAIVDLLSSYNQKPKNVKLHVTWTNGLPTETACKIISTLLSTKPRNNDEEPGLILMGHSFGACSAMYASGLDTRISHCIGLDPWMYPMPLDTAWIVNRSLQHCVINSGGQAFQWPENLSAISDFIRVSSSASQFDHNKVYELVGSTHQDFADLVCLIPRWVFEFARRPLSHLHPHVALLQTTVAILKFLDLKDAFRLGSIIKEEDLEEDLVWKRAFSMTDLMKHPRANYL